MEITDKDFELVDNYLDGTLSDEELALFRIRMHDEEFAGLLHFQQELRKELNQPSLLSPSPMQRADTYYQEYRLHSKRRVTEALNSKWWFLLVAVMCLTAVLVSLIVTTFAR